MPIIMPIAGGSWVSLSYVVPLIVMLRYGVLLWRILRITKSRFHCGAMTGASTRLEAVAVLLLPWTYILRGIYGSLGNIVANKDRAPA
jgi:hypothetical protein